MLKLAILIPTFNRHAELLKRLSELISQLSTDVNIFIFDNNSCPPISETLAKSSFSLQHIKIIRNNKNIGADANILECLLFESSEWAWLLGDDDSTADNSVSNILNTIASVSGRTEAIKFSSSCGINIENQLISIKNFSSMNINISLLSNILFISSTVFKTGAFKKNLNLCNSTGTMATQLISLMTILSFNGLIYFSVVKIISNNAVGNWSYAELEANLASTIKLTQNQNIHRFLSELSFQIKKSPIILLDEIDKLKIDYGKYYGEQVYISAIINRNYFYVKNTFFYFILDHLFFLFFNLNIHKIFIYPYKKYKLFRSS